MACWTLWRGREGRSPGRGSGGLNDREARHHRRRGLAPGVGRKRRQPRRPRPRLGGPRRNGGFGRQSWSASSPEWRVLAGFWPEIAGGGRVPPSYRRAPAAKCSEVGIIVHCPRGNVRAFGAQKPLLFRCALAARSLLSCTTGGGGRHPPRRSRPTLRRDYSMTLFDSPRDLGPPRPRIEGRRTRKRLSRIARHLTPA